MIIAILCFTAGIFAERYLGKHMRGNIQTFLAIRAENQRQSKILDEILLDLRRVEDPEMRDRIYTYVTGKGADLDASRVRIKAIIEKQETRNDTAKTSNNSAG